MDGTDLARVFIAALVTPYALWCMLAGYKRGKVGLLIGGILGLICGLGLLFLLLFF